MQPPTSASRTYRLVLLVLAAATVVGAVEGWRLFYFLTDDAFIAFRYVANSIAGAGLVWNRAPFHPVEGYTSFLWVILLREMWSWFGIQPPVASGLLSLLFGLGTLALCFRMALRMSLPAAVERWRLVLLALMLLGTLTNPTFLAWLSSGLETALFNFLFTWWLYESFSPNGIDRSSRAFRLSLSAALCALCRPDGLLLVAGALLQLAVSWRRGRFRLVAALPLLMVPAHLLWRRRFYGAWLPNTYYAKVGRPWPEAGVRYAASFVIEFGVGVWLLLLVVWGVRALMRREWRPITASRLVGMIAVLVLLGHWSFYTFKVGGDHFEYRVYSHLIPLLFLSAGWMAARIAQRGMVAAAAVMIFVVASWPIPWLHWSTAQQLTTRQQADRMILPLASRFPQPLRPMVAEWDSLQAWLIEHYVCVRHQEHKVFWQWRSEMYPSVSEGALVGQSERAVIAVNSAGIAAWSLPNADVIDMLGLNDRIIARYGIRSHTMMAHDLRAPEGYIACFRPDVVVRNGHVSILPNVTPLTDDEVRACESKDWSQK